MDAIGVQVGAAIAVEIHFRQGAHEVKEIGYRLTRMVTGVQRVPHVEDLPAVVDLPVGDQAAQGTDVVQIEMPLVIAERTAGSLVEKCCSCR